MLFASGATVSARKPWRTSILVTGGPRRATWLVVGLAAAVNTICWLTGWLVADTGNPAIDTYFLFAVAGSVCLMVCYLLVEIAAMWFVGRRGSRRCTVGWGRRRVAAARPGRGVHRGGVVVQRQGLDDVAGAPDPRVVLVRNRCGCRGGRVTRCPAGRCRPAAEVGLPSEVRTVSAQLR